MITTYNYTLLYVKAYHQLELSTDTYTSLSQKGLKRCQTTYLLEKKALHIYPYHHTSRQYRTVELGALGT